MKTALVRLTLGVTILLLAGYSLASDIVYFKNGKALRVKSQRIQDGWVHVTLDGGSQISFPVEVVDHISREDGVKTEQVSISLVPEDNSVNKNRPKTPAPETPRATATQVPTNRTLPGRPGNDPKLKKNVDTKKTPKLTRAPERKLKPKG